MNKFNTPLLKKRFAKAAVAGYPEQEIYVNLPSDAEGKLQPVVLGSILTAGPNSLQQFLNTTPTILIDIGTDQGSGVWRGRKFKVASDIKNPETGKTHGFNIVDVYRYQDLVATLLTVDTHYTLSDNSTQIDFANDANGDLKEDALIHCEVSVKDDDAGTFTGDPNTGIGAIPDVLHFLLVCYCGIPTNQIDLASFTSTGDTKQGVSGTYLDPEWGGLVVRAYFNSQTSVKDAISVICFYSNHTIQLVNGKYTLVALSDLTTASDVTLIDAEITDWEETYRLDSIVNRIAVTFWQVPAGDQQLNYYENRRQARRGKRKPLNAEVSSFLIARNSLSSTVGSTTVNNDFGVCVGIEKESVITTYGITPSVSLNFANALESRWGRGIWQASFTDIEGKLMQAKVGDRVVIYRKRSAHGDISQGKAYRLVDMIKNYALNTVTVNRADAI